MEDKILRTTPDNAELFPQSRGANLEHLGGIYLAQLQQNFKGLITSMDIFGNTRNKVYFR